MYHVIHITVKDKKLCEYFDELTKNYNNMINVTHFHIRQLMTGLVKPEAERQPNEIDVINSITTALPQMNAPKLTKKGLPKKSKNNLKRKKKVAAKKENEPPKEKQAKFKMPTEKSYIGGYQFWDAYFKTTNNVDYYNLPAQVNQEAIKTAMNEWENYKEALKSYYKDNSAFNGKPNIPGYRKSGVNATATIPNYICKLVEKAGNYALTFPKTKLTLKLNNGGFIDGYTLKETQIVPEADYFKVLLVMDDEKEEMLPDEETNLFGEVNRVIGIDLGIDNLAAISNNIGLNPIVIKGKTIKSYNQWFNKKNAELQSCIDTKTENILYGFDAKTQKNLIFAYRDRFFRDIFHKISKYIVNYCVEHNIDTIVIGKNKQQKQDINIGKRNNQTFCTIPHQTLVHYITYKAYRKKINVIITEESYTSKASFLDNDNIPEYQKGDDTKYTFSGKRIHRGLYESADGIQMNADINGASNIIRKAIPTAFNSIEDFSYLYKTVESKNYHDFTRYQKSKLNLLNVKA